MTIFEKLLNDIAEKQFAISASSKELGFFEHSSTRTTDNQVLIIIGPNGSGKSLLGKLAESVLRAEKVPVRSVAVRNRTKPGVEKAMIFGDESRQSTGFTSVYVCNLAMQSAAGEDGAESVILYDEPDLGLSEEYADALGFEMGRFAKHHPKVKSILISHNKSLISAFLAGYGNEQVNVVAFHPYPCDLPQWLSRKEPPISFNKLLELRIESDKTERKIDKFFSAKKKT